jgi:hypothetical protein
MIVTYPYFYDVKESDKTPLDSRQFHRSHSYIRPILMVDVGEN